MADISVSDLQAIAVDCTSRFLNEGVPLSTSLAKQASDRGLNSDQLQRAVEATNTLTYLKSLEVNGDRTSEFPLADFRTIVKQACIPDSSTVAADFVPGDSFEKTASFAETQLASTKAPIEAQAARAILKKEASANLRRIEDLRGLCEVLHHDLLKVGKDLGKDPAAIEKLASVCKEEATFQKLAMLVTGKVQKRPDYAELLFAKQASSLDQATRLAGLLKEAQESVKELAFRKELAQRHAEFTKQAFLIGAAGAVLGGLGKGLASGLGSLAGKAIGSGLKGTGKLMTAPVMAAGKTLGSPQNAGQAARAAKNAFAASGVGKMVGMKPLEGPPTPAMMAFRRKLKIGGVAGGMVLDAAAYSPKVDPANDHSGSVWASLQSPPL